MGVGHPGRKDLVSHYVLQDFAKADREWLDDLLRGVSDGAPFLADGQNDRFLNAVAQRVAPSRPSKPVPSATGDVSEKAEPKEPQDAPDTRSALQRLVDRFR